MEQIAPAAVSPDSDFYYPPPETVSAAIVKDTRIYIDSLFRIQKAFGLNAPKNWNGFRNGKKS